MRTFDTTRQAVPLRRAVALLVMAFAAGAAFAQSKADPSRGEGRSAACGRCHGTPEQALPPGTPSLAGQPEQFLVLQMFLMREGLRDVPQMAGTMNDLSDRDLEDIAAHYSRQAIPRSNAKPDPQLHARGAGLAKAMGCASCHLGFKGQKHLPRLANQREDYLVASMKAYRDNKRVGPDTSMNGMMYQVTDGDIQALAHYLAHQ